MRFKNLTIFSFEGSADIQEFPMLQETNNLTPTIGWLVANYYTGETQIDTNNATLFSFGIDEKIIPSSVLNKELDKSVREIEQKESRKVGRKEKLDIKDEIAFSLLPRAFNKTTSSLMYVDKLHNLIFVDSCSAKMTNVLYDLIDSSFKDLKITGTLLGSASISATMTDWLLHDCLPPFLETGNQCSIKDAENSLVSKGFEPLSDDITRHLDEGMTVDSLSVSWSDKLSFTIDSKLNIKGIKFLDLLEKQHEQDQGDQNQDFVSDFILHVLTFRELVMSLYDCFSLKGDVEQLLGLGLLDMKP